MSKKRQKRAGEGLDPSIQPVQPQQLKEWFELGIAAHQSGRLAEAKSLYESVLRYYPSHPDSLHLLGVIASHTGHFQQGESLIRKAISQLPTAAVYHNSLGSLHRDCGRATEAEASFRKALSLDQNYAEAYNNLGVVHKESQRLQEALQYYEKALSLKPDYADAYSNLGCLHLAQGRMRDAEQALTRALELNARHADANFNLGMVLRADQRDAESVAFFNRAVTYQPDYVKAYLELGRVLEELGNHADAMRCFDEALKHDPDNIWVRLAKGQSLLGASDANAAQEILEPLAADQPDNPFIVSGLGAIRRARGDLEGARACFEQVLRAHPNFPAAYQGLASISRSDTLDQDKAGVLLAQIANERTTREARMGCHFALGKMYDDAQMYDLAFEHFAAGNKLKEADFSMSAYSAMIDRVIATFDQTFFDKRRDWGDVRSDPVFIVGMPRSGTTLTEQILATHSQVFGAGERPFIPRLVSQIGDASSPSSLAAFADRFAELDRSEVAQMAAQYTSDLPAEEVVGKLRVTDKLPANFLYLGIIAVLYPNAKVIHARRDPLDTCLSCYFQNFRTGQEFSYDLKTLGFYYRQYQRLMEHWNQVLPLRIYENHYEKLVAEQEEYSRRLIAYLGLEWDEACLAFYQNTRSIYTASVWQVRQPVYHSSLARWRHYESHLGPLKEALAGVS